jgi:hypothetical protein
MALQKSVSKSRKSIKSMQRLPHLASSLLQVSLPEEVKQLRQQESWLRGTGRSSKTLVKYPDLRVVLISMKANTVMKEQKTEARITILKRSRNFIVITRTYSAAGVMNMPSSPML